MVRNEENYDQAVRLRERGFTLQEIAKVCDVSKSTVSMWLKNNAISAEVTKQNKRRAGQANAKRLQLFSKARQVERDKRYQEAIRSAEVEYKHYCNDPLFVAGLMLYIGLGDQSDRAKIRVSSSRAAVHRMFITFMTQYMGVERDKIRFWMVLYPDMKETTCFKHWQKTINISPTQWHKTQVIPGKAKKPTLQFGVGNTIIVSTVLKYKLNRWIELAETNIQ